MLHWNVTLAAFQVEMLYLQDPTCTCGIPQDLSISYRKDPTQDPKWQ